MGETNITINFDAAKLDALEFALRKQRSSVQRRMAEMLQQLYESEVPEAVREYVDIAGYGMSKREVLERVGRRRSAASQDESYISLTEIARAHSEDAPGYVIQRWLRSENTLAFLKLWEKENNPDYSDVGYIKLLEKKKTASFTLTPKLWIEETKAIGIVSKQGKSGGTFAHPMIACEFASWIAPEFKMLLLKLSLNRTKLS